MASLHRNSGHAVAGYVGLALVFIGAMLLVPLLTLVAYPDEVRYAPCIIFPGVLTMLVGYLVYFFGARDAAAMALSRAEAAGVTVLIWILAVAAYALPLVAAGLLTVPQAIFESTSGLTTTGLSVVDVAACPHVMLMHRGMMHYVGGVGLILVLTCIVSDAHGLKLYSAEGHTERLLSSTASSARMVLALYTGIIALGAAAYVIAGMPVFDAINISISAVSTGGFAVRPDSMAAYNSFPIGLFQTVSVMTSTGLQTIPSFGLLVPGILYLLVFLMIVGGEAGSTSGGIKVYRLVVYSRGLIWSLRERFGHRRRVYSTKINRFGKLIPCSKDEIASIQTFVGVYVGLLVICGFLFTLFGASVGDAVFEAASCLGNTGISVGFLNAGSSPVVLIAGSVAMLFGRLEIFPLIFGLRWMLQSIEEEVRHAAQH